ncbi:hypothetical protein ALQ16_204074 [Pseudomonas syringae pv. actinidiae]|nr:hypothetical protein ALQ16_204074 [Pseudomonas syringae pv. actinidiae]RMS09986.1 hypothetical protein ALP75_203905 [Pseudomonas syringae pv. actinidiae]
MTVGVYLNIATTGSHIACRLYADTLFGADQLDRVGVHTAKRRGINGQLRLVGGIGSTLCGRQRVGVDVVGTGDDVELFCVDIGVDLRRTGDQIELVDCACIQAFAIDRDAAAVHGKVVEFAIRIEYRLASAEGDTRRVDKAAAAAGDAIRVGNDHPCRLPGHFGVAIELAGVGASHFIEDGAGGTSAQLAIAENIAAQLCGLYGIGRVVENHAFAVDVVLLVLVVRQPRAVGCGDVDHRHAIASLAYGRIGGPADCYPVGLRPDRLPEHDVGQQQSQQALGNAQKSRALGYCSRGLTCQQSQLMSVHVGDLGAALLKEKVHTEVNRRFALDHVGTFQGMGKSH